MGDLENSERGVLRVRFRTLKRKNHVRLISLPAIGARAVRAWLQVRDGRGSRWLFPGALGKPLCVRAIEKRVAMHLAAIGRARPPPSFAEAFRFDGANAADGGPVPCSATGWPCESDDDRAGLPSME